MTINQPDHKTIKQVFIPYKRISKASSWCYKSVEVTFDFFSFFLFLSCYFIQWEWKGKLRSKQSPHLFELIHVNSRKITPKHTIPILPTTLQLCYQFLKEICTQTHTHTQYTHTHTHHSGTCTGLPNMLKVRTDVFMKNRKCEGLKTIQEV